MSESVIRLDVQLTVVSSQIFVQLVFWPELQQISPFALIPLLRMWSVISSPFGRQNWDAMLGANRAVWPCHISDL